MQYNVALFRLKYEGLIEMIKGDINATSVIFEAGSKLNLAYRGYGANQGPGAGGDDGKTWLICK